MVLEEAVGIFKSSWWKRYKTPEHENYEIIIDKVLEEHEHSVVLIAAAVKKGKQPEESDYRTWQIDDDGDCGVLIQG